MGLYPLVYGDEFLFLFYIMVDISLHLIFTLAYVDGFCSFFFFH